MQYVKMFIQVILIITPVFICQFPQNSNLQIKFPKCKTNNDCGHGTCDLGSGVCKCDDHGGCYRTVIGLMVPLRKNNCHYGKVFLHNRRSCRDSG